MKKPEKQTAFKGFLILVSLLPAFYALAQGSDAGMWNTFTLEKDLTKKISVFGETELRLHENWSRLDLLYFEAGGNYKIARGLKVGLGYRMTAKQDEEKYYWMGFRFRHRLMFNLHYNFKWRQFIFAYRFRLQTEMKYIYSSDKGPVPDWEMRNRLEVRYVINRLEPYAGAELNYQFTNPRHPESDFEFYRYRIFAGINYHINRYNSIEVYYMFEKKFNMLLEQNGKIPSPAYLYILGVHYTVSLPVSKKRK